MTKATFRNRMGRVLENNLFQHILFWGFSFYLLLQHFASSSEFAAIDLIYTGVFMVSIIVVVYINLLILIPMLFQKGLYFWYSLCTVLALATGIELNIFSFEYLTDIFFPGYYLISYYDRWEILKYLIVFLGITSLLHFSKSWFLLRETEARVLQLEKIHAETELKALQAQVNPHFLFNSLNSIYSLIMKGSVKAEEATLRLSDALRYMIYDTRTQKVPLKKEMEYLHNYLELQKLRSGARDLIDFKLEGSVNEQQIAPLLTIPLVENSFKHGIKGDTGKAFVSISMRIEENDFRMSIENSKGDAACSEAHTPTGIGLDNVKKRLELLYPDRYKLEIEDVDDKFKVMLYIDLS